MKKTNSNVACAGMDVHYKFSNVTFRDTSGRIVSRQWLDHRDRMQLQGRLSRWPVTVFWRLAQTIPARTIRAGPQRDDILAEGATNGGKRDCNRGYIKVARELVKVVYAIWAKGIACQETAPVYERTIKQRTRYCCSK